MYSITYFPAFVLHSLTRSSPFSLPLFLSPFLFFCHAFLFPASPVKMHPQHQNTCPSSHTLALWSAPTEQRFFSMPLFHLLTTLLFHLVPTLRYDLINLNNEFLFLPFFPTILFKNRSLMSQLQPAHQYPLSLQCFCEFPLLFSPSSHFAPVGEHFSNTCLCFPLIDFYLHLP